MRANGLVHRVSDLGATAHICFAYDDPVTFRSAAREFAEDGLLRGDRLLCIGDESALRHVRDAISELSDVDDLIDRGTLHMLPLDSAYGAAMAPQTAHQQLELFDSATRRALADGFVGLRVIADVTALAADRSRHALHVQWEHLADDYIATGRGMSALCAYHRPALDEDDDVLADIAAVHPSGNVAHPRESFRIYFDNDRLLLAGSADSFCAERLERLLTTSHRNRSGLITVDVHALEFIDGRACAAIAGWADTLNLWSGHLRIAGASRTFRRVWQVLGFDVLTNASFAELAA